MVSISDPRAHAHAHRALLFNNRLRAGAKSRSEQSELAPYDIVPPVQTNNELERITIFTAIIIFCNYHSIPRSDAVDYKKSYY